MKTITKTYELYSFDELSYEAKKKALNDNYAINVEWDWWQTTYEDADNVGLKISGFDIGRGRCCNMSFKSWAIDTAESILQEHGEVCDTYKYAKAYKEAYDKNNGEDLDELDAEFLNNLAYCYLVMLREEYSYQTSEEGIRDTFEANEYTFLEDGTMFNE
ncbi:MAG: hypothetical protein ACM3QX_18370 [Syntrophomonadaceae bacterium]